MFVFWQMCSKMDTCLEHYGLNPAFLYTGNFEWHEDQNSFTADKINDLVISDLKGNMLEVDAKYPKEIHDMHNDVPFVNWFHSLFDKKNYFIHIKSLDQALSIVWFEKSSRSGEFDQTAMFKTYIDVTLNWEPWIKMILKKHFFKLMNNSIFCKTMGNIRNHKDIRPATNQK